ncbi:Weak similarity to Ypseudotuberculosis CDP-3,6-dideoxy-D-glycero-L-glycero-4-hexulose-5-epimerase [Teratosphaeria destructans]|uniref:Weak similarity to Ypseudotuberculosis CDP-3, 6-dideoxy-D-glycero-L-glycero-4-hexulose-5-epimerase n=1 Tax=Teratosphaeria destructans TaxID=418781 RepID=A0A9W7SHY8_9PEZI|nr:Weak similarity to Ypseudotuberculosis CDP-3,6-dideoxy-D-glycero-L-glycero-4-hexulose-5-epimerase [Teratosphaeria destructans]
MVPERFDVMSRMASKTPHLKQIPNHQKHTATITMSTGKEVFIIGPGFIGWNVLDLLIAEGYTVTGFVRRQEHADQINASGATAVIGDLGDRTNITEHAAQADIVIHTATADHLPSVQAVLDGVKQRARKGQMTIYIHTSGTSVLDDGAEGSRKSEKVYHDNVRSEIDSVPESAPHREIDLAIVQAQEELGEKAKIAIMIPYVPNSYHIPSSINPDPVNPAHNRLTIQIPTLTRFALKHHYAAHVGPGHPVESNIHVLDLARAYITLLHHLEVTAPSQPLSHPYYFCESTGSSEPSWREIADLIGQKLFEAGRIPDPKPRMLPRELYGDVFGAFTGAVIGLNSRSRAVRLRELGWAPREKDWRASFVEDELPVILREGVEGFGGYQGTVAS